MLKIYVTLEIKVIMLFVGVLKICNTYNSNIIKFSEGA